MNALTDKFKVEVPHFAYSNAQEFTINHLEWVEERLRTELKLSNSQTHLLLNRADVLVQRFYISVNTSGRSVLFEVVGLGRSEIVPWERISAFQRQKWGQIYNFGKIKMTDLLPVVNAEIYYPLPYPLVQINSAVYFNTYEPPLVLAATEYRQPMRPLLWQEFLDRWFPSNSVIQDVLEAYISKLVFDPINRPRWAMVFRSDQGTGKNFLSEYIMGPLLGSSNVVPTSLEKLIGRFNGGMFDKKLIILNEVNNDRKATYNKLKDKVTDTAITVEEKFKNPRVQPLYCGIWVFSNEDYPLYVDPDDRRFYVTPRLVHKVDQVETSEFIASFAEWLEALQPLVEEQTSTTGLGQLASWLKHVADSGYHGVNFNSLPKDGNCSSEIMACDTSLELLGDLTALLSKPSSQDSVWQVSRLRKHGSPFRMLKEGQVSAALEDHGYYRSENILLENKQLTTSGDPTVNRVRGYAYKGRGIKGAVCQSYGSPPEV